MSFEFTFQTYKWWKTADASEPRGRSGGYVYVKNHTENNVNLLKPTGYVMNQQFNVQQLYALLTLYLCVLYLSENKQRLVPLTA